MTGSAWRLYSRVARPCSVSCRLDVLAVTVPIRPRISYLALNSNTICQTGLSNFKVSRFFSLICYTFFCLILVLFCWNSRDCFPGSFSPTLVRRSSSNRRLPNAGASGHTGRPVGWPKFLLKNFRVLNFKVHKVGNHYAEIRSVSFLIH